MSTEISPLAKNSSLGTILLVEDHALVRTVTRQLLEIAGYRVLVAENGSKALSFSVEQLRDVRLLITDVVMPGISGTDLAAHLHRRIPDLRIIFISGFAKALAHRELAEPSETTAFLQKPYRPDTLLATIDRFLTPRE